MKSLNPESVLKSEPPWVYEIGNEAESSELVNFVRNAKGGRLFTLEGVNMATSDGFYDEFIRVFELPDYFGRNLNALNECLSDLDWLELETEFIVVLVKDSDEVLKDEGSDAREGMLDCFKFIGEEWAEPIELGEEWDRGAIPFHFILA